VGDSRSAPAVAWKEVTAEEKEQIGGLLKEPPRIRSPYDRLPAELQAARLWALAQPRHHVADGFLYFEEEFAEMYAARQKNSQPLGGTPLVILLTKPGLEIRRRDSSRRVEAD
jgi:hypothetical protein